MMFCYDLTWEVSVLTVRFAVRDVLALRHS